MTSDLNALLDCTRVLHKKSIGHPLTTTCMSKGGRVEDRQMDTERERDSTSSLHSGTQALMVSRVAPL